MHRGVTGTLRGSAVLQPESPGNSILAKSRLLPELIQREPPPDRFGGDQKISEGATALHKVSSLFLYASCVMCHGLLLKFTSSHVDLVPPVTRQKLPAVSVLFLKWQ